MKITVLLALYQCSQLVATLVCYTCGDPRDDGPCSSDTSGLLKAFRGDKTLYYKDCSATNRSMCMIQSISSQGRMVSFIRDCITRPDYVQAVKKFPRLKSVRSSNSTSCDYDSIMGKQMCVTLCASKDFCNGPLFTVNAAGSFPCHPRVMILLTIVVFLKALVI